MMIALRTWRAVAVGTACLSTAAIPETVGVENEVPLPKLTVAGLCRSPWLKLYDPLATTSGSTRPSCVGPRELKSEICMFMSGRQACAHASTEASGAGAARRGELRAEDLLVRDARRSADRERRKRRAWRPVVTDEKPSLPAAITGRYRR